MKRNLSADIRYHVLLTVITLLLLLLPLERDMFFGSEGDWYSQHVGIAESLRQTMLETGSLIPQYIRLGGGSSIYDFSYYGLLRPDILFSCLVPKMEMKYVIAGYSVFSAAASVHLCYLWLKRQNMLKGFAFAGAVLLAASSCFYHAHHQIMFVNYMPFLFLALLGVDRMLDKGKITLLVFSLFMIYLHSFYYAIACLLVIGIYTIHQILLQEERRKSRWKQMGSAAGKLVFAAMVSIGMAMVLLLPTGLDILSNEKDAGSFAASPIKMADWSLKGLLYSPYGCGMTLLTLYCLLLSVTKKRKRFLSVLLIICVLFPMVSYVLNGFLYARSKILIPFVTLFVWVSADTLQELYQGKQRRYMVLLVCCFIPALCSSWKPLVLMDGGILIIWILLQQADRISEKVKIYTFWMIMIVPVLVSLGVNMSDSYLKSACSTLGISTGGAYLKAEDNRQSSFSMKAIADFAADSRYRFDVLSDSFVNCNLLADGEVNKTAMYSSVTNTDYAKFYYDIIKNPIRLNNRVALIPSVNPCFSYFMGLKYVLAKEDELPYGYKKIEQNGSYILARNDNVLPVCYGTAELLSENDYQSMDFPDTLEALCSRAVVPADTMEKAVQGGAGITDAIVSCDTDKTEYNKNTFVSHIKKENVEDFFAEGGEKKLLNPSGEKECFVLPLASPLRGKILILSLHVESNEGKEVIISINGIKNKLSSPNAPYPNNNHDFTYLLSAGDVLEKLEVEVSKGKYTVDNLEVYTVDSDMLKHSDVVIPEIKKHTLNKGQDVFQGEIIMKQGGYFITSYPYRKGYQIKVDGVEVAGRKVNTAFIGFPVGAGKHQIKITYEAPGFKLGCTVSLISGMLFGLVIVLERKCVYCR